MICKPILRLSCFLAGSLALAQLQAPRIGLVRQSDGTVRPLFGMTANVLYGDPVPLSGATAASFSGQAGLIATAGHIFLTDADGMTLDSFETPEEKPFLSITDGPTTAFVWLPSANVLLQWNGRGFTSLSIDGSRLTGSLVDIRNGPHGSVAFLVNAPDGSVQRNLFSRRDGEYIASEIINGVIGPAFPADSLYLHPDPQGLQVESEEGVISVLTIRAADLTFEHAGKQWIHATSAENGQQWLLHITDRTVEVTELPASPTRPVAEPVAEAAQ